MATGRIYYRSARVIVFVVDQGQHNGRVAKSSSNTARRGAREGHLAERRTVRAWVRLPLSPWCNNDVAANAECFSAR